MPIVVAADSRARLRQLATIRRTTGFTNVAIQRAGFLGTRDFFGRSDPGWDRLELPTSREPEAGRSWAEMEEPGK